LKLLTGMRPELSGHLTDIKADLTDFLPKSEAGLLIPRRIMLQPLASTSGKGGRSNSTARHFRDVDLLIAVPLGKKWSSQALLCAAPKVR
jgi:hypothetical protein